MTDAATVNLTLPDLFVIHELLIETFGGIRGVSEQGFGKLEAALAAPDQSMFGEDLYPDIPSKAAALFFHLVRAHGFSDGNKRIALVALLLVLEQHGLRLRANDDDLYNLAMMAASDGMQDQVMEWIVERIETDGN